MATFKNRLPVDISNLQYHKRISDSSITVDCFDIPVLNCSHYFLSHFHSDHYTRLSKSFNHLVYCSETTAALVSERIGAVTVGLKMYTTYYIGDFYVRLVDANHCPGAVIFVFLIKNEYFIHTGDFRYDQKLHKFNFPIKNAYIDNTYEDYKDFPTQEVAISEILKIFDQKDKLCPMNICVLCCTYSVGKEKIFLSVGEYLNKPVQVTEDKMAIYQCYDKYTIDRLNNEVMNIVKEKRQNLKTFGFLRTASISNQLKSIEKKPMKKKSTSYRTLPSVNIKKNKNKYVRDMENIESPYKKPLTDEKEYNIKTNPLCCLNDITNNISLKEPLTCLNDITNNISLKDPLTCLNDPTADNSDTHTTKSLKSTYQWKSSIAKNIEYESDSLNEISIDFNFLEESTTSNDFQVNSSDKKATSKPFDRLTLEESSVKVISMSELHSFDFSKIFADKIYILCGTGWKERKELRNYKRFDGRQIKNGIEIIHFRYSEHSSSKELLLFQVENKIENVINTVNK